jgi:glycosyltransferase involved in cell wall biosynthesis
MDAPGLDRLRVVQVVPWLGFGGLERVAATLTARLAPHVERIVVCSAGGEAFVPVIREAGVEIVWIRRPRPDPRSVLVSGTQLSRVFRRERPDVVHAHNPAAVAAAAAGRIVAGMPRLPIVASYHGMPGGHLPRGAGVLRFAAAASTAVSADAADELRREGLPDERLFTIENGADPRPQRARDDVRAELGVGGAEFVVAVGRYQEEKNHQLLLRAAALLAPRRPRLRVLIVGEHGPAERSVRDLVTELGLESVVTLIGPRTDVADVIAAADLLAHPSSREALGLVLVEAMAVGTPVVATAVGGVPAFISDGENGLLVPPGDADALAVAIERLLDDEALRRRLAAAGRVTYEARFTLDRMVEGYASVYLSVARATRRRSGPRRS